MASGISLNACADSAHFRSTLVQLATVWTADKVVVVKTWGNHTQLEIRARNLWEEIIRTPTHWNPAARSAISRFVDENRFFISDVDVTVMRELVRKTGVKREDLPVDMVLHAADGDVKALRLFLREIPFFDSDTLQKMTEGKDQNTLDIDLRQVADVETLSVLLDYYYCDDANWNRSLTHLRDMGAEQFIKLFELAHFLDSGRLGCYIYEAARYLEDKSIYLSLSLKTIELNEEIFKEVVKGYDQTKFQQFLLYHRDFLKSISQELLTSFIEQLKDLNNSDANYMLGFFYQTGVGVEQNNKQANFFSHLASTQARSAEQKKVRSFFYQQQHQS